MTLVIERRVKKKLAKLPDLPKGHPHGHTAADVRAAGFTLQPMVCVNAACPDPLSGNVAFQQSAGDAYCSVCGEYQDDVNEERRSDG